MDLNFTPQEEAFRAEVQRFLNDDVPARLKEKGDAGKRFTKADFEEWHALLNQKGWLASGWPVEYGGTGWNPVEKFIFDNECALAHTPRVQPFGLAMVAPVIIKYGNEEQKRYWLPRILNGQDWWCQGYSEPGAGSDLAAISTRCWQDEDGRWRVQGQKVWTSLAHESEWIFVIARSTPGSVGREGLSFLLVPLDQPGIEIHPIRQLTGEAEFNSVFFDGAVTEADCIVGQPGEGWKVAMALLGFERGVSTLGQQMHFSHELQLLLEVARANGAAQDPAIRQRIADAWIGLQGLRYNGLRMLEDDTGSTKVRPEALIYKYAWSNWHRDLGQLAMDVIGVAGDVRSDEDAVRRLQQVFFFSRSDTIYAGTNEIQLNIISERGLGMPRG